MVSQATYFPGQTGLSAEDKRSNGCSNENGNIPPGNKDPFEGMHSVKKKTALFEM